MRVHVTIDRVRLAATRAPAGTTARLLARLETTLAARLAELPAATWQLPADSLGAPVRAAVAEALRPATRPGERP